MACTVAQFWLNAKGVGLDRYQFITLITTTSGSVFGFWLLVGRYLFGRSSIDPSNAASTPPRRGSRGVPEPPQ
jgi:hypothetical protein